MRMRTILRQGLRILAIIYCVLFYFIFHYFPLFYFIFHDIKLIRINEIVISMDINFSNTYKLHNIFIALNIYMYIKNINYLF